MPPEEEESDVIFIFGILALLYLVAIVWVWLRVIMRRCATT